MHQVPIGEISQKEKEELLKALDKRACRDHTKPDID